MQTAARVGDRPRDQEVDRRAAAFAEDDVEQAPERLATDEQRQGLVLVRRPSGELDEEEGRGRHGAQGNARQEQPPVEVSGRPAEPRKSGCRGVDRGRRLVHRNGGHDTRAKRASDCPASLDRLCRSTNFAVRMGICSS